MLKNIFDKIKGMGLAKKFIILSVAFLIFFDILASDLIISDLDRTLSEGLNQRGNFLVKHLSEEIGGILLNEDNKNMSQIAENIINADNEVEYVFITDSRNRIIMHTFRNDIQIPGIDGNASFDISGGNIIDFKAPIPGTSGGYAHVGMDTTSIRKKINMENNIVAVYILTEGALGILMAFIAGNYLARPIRTLVKGAQEIGRGNLGYMIELDTNDNEMQTLSNALNQMSNDLKKNMDELLKLSTAVEEAPDGIQIADIDGRIIYSNKAVEKIYGFSPDEFKGKRINETNVIPDSGSNVIISSIKDSGRWFGELTIKRKDGKEIPIMLSTSIVKDNNGEPLAVVGIIRDITDMKEKEKLEKQLLQADKLATIGRLAAGVAHEINNPLGNISLYTQLLIKKTEDQKTIKKLKVIADETGRAANIIKGLLDFARQSELELSPIDINREIDKVLTILKPQLRDIQLKKDFEFLPQILADSGQIQQVIMNLLTNSIQSIIENGEITVRTSAKQDHVEISISDNGCGIPEENLDKIFDPFFSTKEQGKGTGLGLSISYGIIKRHRGSIEVQSEPGEGTTFTIKLPV